ncbi:MAG: hypothetical protein AAGD14_13745 [Planctomycetota bacterium]
MARRLSDEIRSFNAEIDFRLRFLHMEIEEVVLGPKGVSDDAAIELPEEEPLAVRAARLALVLAQQRPVVFVVVGDGAWADAAAAAAIATDVRFAVFGASAAGSLGTAGDDVLDLGDDPATALDRLTGVAREIR